MRVHLELQLLIRPSQPWLFGAVEDHIGRFESHAAPDIDSNLGAALDASEAGRGAPCSRTVVEKLRRNGELLRSHTKGEARDGGGAGEDITAVGAAVLGAWDGAVVGRGDGSRQVEEGGTRVSDTADGLCRPCISDTEAGGAP